MPVTHHIERQRISDDEFRSLDYGIMGLAFGVHHDFGNLCNEEAYQMNHDTIQSKTILQ